METLNNRISRIITWVLILMVYTVVIFGVGYVCGIVTYDSIEKLFYNVEIYEN